MTVMTIFVIDDHPLMRDAIASLLRRLQPGMHVVELECLADTKPAKTSYGPPQVIFLDLNLPDATGCCGVHHVKTSIPNVPLAVHSALLAAEMEKSCLEAGADLYVEKTTDARHLAAALSSLPAPFSCCQAHLKAGQPRARPAHA